ncbi:hypothetical protein FRX31_015007, partial [Thalictrum thalictroides]
MFFFSNNPPQAFLFASHFTSNPTISWGVPFLTNKNFLMEICKQSFVLTGLIETAVVSYFDLSIGELSLDQKAELLFLDQAVATATAAVLGVIYGLVYKPQPLSDDFFSL